jgi:hypothetical protein
VRTLFCPPILLDNDTLARPCACFGTWSNTAKPHLKRPGDHKKEDVRKWIAAFCEKRGLKLKQLFVVQEPHKDGQPHMHFGVKIARPDSAVLRDLGKFLLQNHQLAADIQLLDADDYGDKFRYCTTRTSRKQACDVSPLIYPQTSATKDQKLLISKLRREEEKFDCKKLGHLLHSRPDLRTLGDVRTEAGSNPLLRDWMLSNCTTVGEKFAGVYWLVHGSSPGEIQRKGTCQQRFLVAFKRAMESPCACESLGLKKGGFMQQLSKIVRYQYDHQLRSHRTPTEEEFCKQILLAFLRRDKKGTVQISGAPDTCKSSVIRPLIEILKGDYHACPGESDTQPLLMLQDAKTFLFLDDFRLANSPLVNMLGTVLKLFG